MFIVFDLSGHIFIGMIEDSVTVSRLSNRITERTIIENIIKFYNPINRIVATTIEAVETFEYYLSDYILYVLYVYGQNIR